MIARRRSWVRRFAPMAAVSTLACAMLFTSDARATPRWVDRLLTLPGPVAGTIDLGGSFAHAEQDLGLPPPVCQGYCGWNGTGLNVEGVLGIVGRVDIGLRVGFRGFNDGGNINEGAVANADAYARMYDQVTFYGQYPNQMYGDSWITNPELRVRVRILHLKRIFELGVEVRTIFPFLDGTDATFVVGAPMALHLGRIVRFDFGAYTQLLFLPNNRLGGLVATFQLPAAFWFQVHPRVFLGPMFGFRLYNQDVYPGSTWGSADFLLGFGLGVSLARHVDFKLQAYFPRIEDGGQYFGVGAGVGFYFD